jgi:hypothetical protein
MGAARQPVKLAGIGTTVGILGGLASGRGDDKLRSAGRGAIKGMGFDVGAGMGGALGGALGMATLNPALGIAGLVGGGLGGGMLGQSMASSAIGPYETEEEKFERMLAARESAQLKLKNKEKAAMSLYLFGAKLANYVDLHDSPSSDELISRAKDVKNEAERTGRPVVKDYAKKQLPPHEVFQNALRRAEASGESPSPELFSRMQKEHDSAQKKAQSACSPCAMPNGPKNKPYTSASPAVTDASQKSVEIGKPPVAKTEHSAAKAKLPEEGVKSAIDFGAMMGGMKVAVSPATMLGGIGKKPAPANDFLQMQRPSPSYKAPPTRSTASIGQTVGGAPPGAYSGKTTIQMPRAEADLVNRYAGNPANTTGSSALSAALNPHSPNASVPVSVPVQESGTPKTFGNLMTRPVTPIPEEVAQNTYNHAMMANQKLPTKQVTALPVTPTAAQGRMENWRNRPAPSAEPAPQMHSMVSSPRRVKGSSALSFGAKVAAGFEGVTGVPYSPQSLSAPSNYADLADDMRANQFSPSGAKNTAPRLSTDTGRLVANRQHLNKLQTELNNAPRTNIGPRNMADTVVDAWAAAPGNVANAITNTGKSIAAYGGPRNALDTAVDGYMTGFNALTSAPGKALASAQKLWNEGGNDGGRGYQGPPGSTPQVSGKVGPKPDAPAADGAGTGSSLGGILKMLRDNPGYTAAGGLGALGLGGLMYHLNSQPKKKKRDEEEV